MKILFLTNNDITKPLIDWLMNEEKEEVIVCDKKLTLDLLKTIHPDFIISYNYRYIIKEDIINELEDKIINLHSSFLPWNKGADPNLWSFIEDTPKGVTIHKIDKGIDTGDIIVQKELYFDESTETLSSTYIKLHHAMQELLKSNWNNIKSSNIKSFKHDYPGSVHYIKDSSSIKSFIGENLYNIPIAELKKLYKENIDANTN